MHDRIGLNEFRGLTSRQMDLLDLEAIYEGTQYEGRLPWEMEFGHIEGAVGVQQLCARDKNPIVKAGVVREKVDTLLRMVAPRFPQIEIEGDSERGAKKGAKGPGPLVSRILAEGRLKVALRKPLKDGLVKGSGALGFSLIGDDKRIEIHKFDPAWCEPVLVCKAGSERALALAEEMRQLAETNSDIKLKAPEDDRDALWVPPEATSHDLCWLRYEYASRQSTRDTQGSVMRVRVDYTPHQTIYYFPAKANGSGSWEIERIETHSYGFVPVEWARSADADDGETEGPSIISEQLRTIAEAADYTLTRKDESVGVIANPKLAGIDVQDKVADFNASAGKPTGYAPGSTETIFVHSANGKQGSLQILEITGAGPRAAKEHLDDLNAQAARVSGIITHDPQQAANAQSGVALERMMAPTLAEAGLLVTFGTELLAGFVAKIARAVGVGGELPKVTVTWPPLVEKTAADLAAELGAILQATGSLPVLSQASGVKRAAAALGIEDVDAEVEALGAGAEALVDRVRREIDEEEGETTTEVVGPAAPGAPALPGGKSAPVSNEALAGIQSKTMGEISEKVSAGKMAPDAAKIQLRYSFPSMSTADVDAFVAASVAFTPRADPESTTEVVQEPPPLPEDAK